MGLTDLQILASNVFGIHTFGNIYLVVHASSSSYSKMLTRYGSLTYEDGTPFLYVHNSPNSSTVTTNGIKNALAQTVEDRDDYVVLMPGNTTYFTDEALAINKKAVHLVCPAGLGNDRGSTNAARIQQITSSTAIIAVSDAAVEIAGIFFRNYSDAAAITLAATSYSPNIHHNFFGMTWASAPAAQITCSGDGGGWGTIERNHFTSYAGNSVTAAIAAISIGASATGARANYNTLVIGDGNIATIGISNQAVKGMTCYNLISNSGGNGTVTAGVSIAATGCAIGNRAAVASGGFATGGTAGNSFCDNLDGRSTSGTDIWNLET